MSVLESVLLGIVQGVAEFLPVSSSGHLAIAENLFGIETDGGMLFDILLHLGTLLAVFVVYYKDIWRMIKEFFLILRDIGRNLLLLFQKTEEGEEKRYIRIIRNSYRKFVMLVLVATIPTGVIGYLGRDLVDQAGETLLIPGVGLLITGVLLLICDEAPEGKRTPKHVSYWRGLLIGACQGVATLPGISRSGTTITAGVLCGLDRRFAVKYSFIMSIPAILGAAVLELKDLGQEAVSAGQIGIYAVGAVVSAVVGYICIKTMLIVVRKKKFKYFAFYCFAVGAIACICHFVL